MSPASTVATATLALATPEGRHGRDGFVPRAIQMSGRKNRSEATCRLRSHQFDWELRQFIGRDEIVQTQVCRSQEDVLTTGEQWKAAMIEEGCG